MPNILENNQYHITPDLSYGRDRVNRAHCRSHFFIEDSNFNQSDIQKFGPVSESKFKITNSFTISETKKIYSICKGTIFIQPQLGNINKINLILKPFKQPISNLSIKYIIYRGLDKSDFIVGNKFAPKGDTATGLVNYVWEEYEKFYDVGNGGEAPNFYAKYIGYPENDNDQNDNDLIDHYFFKIVTYTDEAQAQENENTAFELPLIPMGTHLATVSGEMGIDIVLNNGDYYIENDSHPFKLNLAYARVADCFIDTTTVTNLFYKKLLKESVVQFIDIATFYGLHINNLGKLYFAENSNPLIIKSSIYELMNGFANKNRVFIYIQSNRNRSYNFYNDYKISESNNNNIKVGASPDSYEETVFGTLDWPIHIFDDVYNLNENENKLEIQLVIDGADYGSLLYCKHGTLLSEHNNNFLDAEYLISTSETIGYSNSVEFLITNILDDSENKNISNCLFLNYVGRKTNYSFVEDIPLINKKVFYILDGIFDIINIESIYKSLHYERSIVNFNKHILNLENLVGYSGISLLETSINFNKGKKYVNPSDENSELIEKNRVLFISKKSKTTEVIKWNDQSSIFSRKTSWIKSNKNDLEKENYFRGVFGNKNYYTEYFAINDNGFFDVKLLALSHKDKPDNSNICLGLTYEEFNSLKNIIPDDSHNVSFYFKEDSDVQDWDSLNNYTYFKYSLGILYEDINGELQTLLSTPPIFIYSLNLTFFATKEYADYEFYAENRGEGDNLE
ncbi:hypothetical protein [uncultured Kordia sp.]|uniref:hypothetical protein n=1 Tax=uncultured Kordia sp. TaxID=507699 RepID=UPI0026361D68|nr:hypothetical protein [uncultured Kordia sp.]